MTAALDGRLPRNRQGWIQLRDLCQHCVQILLAMPSPESGGQIDTLAETVRRLLDGASAPPLDVGVRPITGEQHRLPDPKFLGPECFRGPSEYEEP